MSPHPTCGFARLKFVAATCDAVPNHCSCHLRSLSHRSYHLRCCLDSLHAVATCAAVSSQPLPPAQLSQFTATLCSSPSLLHCSATLVLLCCCHLLQRHCILLSTLLPPLATCYLLQRHCILLSALLPPGLHAAVSCVAATLRAIVSSQLIPACTLLRSTSAPSCSFPPPLLIAAPPATPLVTTATPPVAPPAAHCCSTVAPSAAHCLHSQRFHCCFLQLPSQMQLSPACCSTCSSLLLRRRSTCSSTRRPPLLASQPHSQPHRCSIAVPPAAHCCTIAAPPAAHYCFTLSSTCTSLLLHRCSTCSPLPPFATLPLLLPAASFSNAAVSCMLLHLHPHLQLTAAPPAAHCCSTAASLSAPPAAHCCSTAAPPAAHCCCSTVAPPAAQCLHT